MSIALSIAQSKWQVDLCELEGSLVTVSFHMFLYSINNFVERTMLGIVPGTSCLWSGLEKSHPILLPPVVIWSSHVERRGLSLEVEPCHLLDVWFRELFDMSEPRFISLTVSQSLLTEIRLDSIWKELSPQVLAQGWAAQLWAVNWGFLASHSPLLSFFWVNFAQFPHLENEHVRLELWFPNFFFSF